MGTRRTGGAVAPTNLTYRSGKRMRATLLIVAALLTALLLLALAMMRPAAAQGVLADGDAAVTGFSGALPPPLIAWDQANLSPMAKSFYAENKRVRNERIKRDLGVTLIYPTYREGLRALGAELKA